MCLRGLFTDWVDVIAAGIDANMAAPSEFGAENVEEGDSGRFFDDYCNWQRIAEFRQVIFESDVSSVASQLMRSATVQLFHDHVLVKEPLTPKPTPWHSDSPYYFVEGDQTVSFWIPIDPVSSTTIRVIAGSHLWEKDVLPTRWLSETDFYPSPDEYLPVPIQTLSPVGTAFWSAIWSPAMPLRSTIAASTARVATPPTSGEGRSPLRFVGDDARFVSRQGPTSPPFHGHGMTDGQRLREDWFPITLRGPSR